MARIAQPPDAVRDQGHQARRADGVRRHRTGSCVTVDPTGAVCRRQACAIGFRTVRRLGLILNSAGPTCYSLGSISTTNTRVTPGAAFFADIALGG